MSNKSVAIAREELDVREFLLMNKKLDELISATMKEVGYADYFMMHGKSYGAALVEVVVATPTRLWEFICNSFKGLVKMFVNIWDDVQVARRSSLLKSILNGHPAIAYKFVEAITDIKERETLVKFMTLYATDGQLVQILKKVTGASGKGELKAEAGKHPNLAEVGPKVEETTLSPEAQAVAAGVQKQGEELRKSLEQQESEVEQYREHVEEIIKGKDREIATLKTALDASNTILRGFGAMAEAAVKPAEQQAQPEKKSDAATSKSKLAAIQTERKNPDLDAAAAAAKARSEREAAEAKRRAEQQAVPAGAGAADQMHEDDLHNPVEPVA